MRIAMLVSAAFPPREGMGFYVWNLARCLTRMGHQVQIITRRAARLPEREVRDGIVIWRPLFAPLYPFHVHLHGLFVERLVKALERQVDVFHCHSPLVPPIHTARPILLTFHSTVREDVQATRLNSLYTLLMKLQAPVSFWLEVENLTNAARVTAVSPPVQLALQRYPGCPATVDVVWNGVDAGLFTPYPGRSEKDAYLLSAGRLGPGKGLEDLLDAFAIIAGRYPDLNLVIAGDGPIRDSLKQRAVASGLQQRCRFVGHIADRVQLAALYQHATLFVMPSHHEGLPTVVLESMACGCPVLSTPVGGVPHVIQDGVNGWLTPPNDPPRMAAALQMLLDEQEWLGELGRQGRNTIETRFSWEKIGAAFAGHYAALAGKAEQCSA